MGRPGAFLEAELSMGRLSGIRDVRSMVPKPGETERLVAAEKGLTTVHEVVQSLTSE
ncbi:hypothetical protein L484_018315 [Morus notabilis]|uniref:Uncharacterized protein n=1 Tax=Morus notabilis TaxID=981085 RepID=W9QGM9_9ROSA|nr:hypothetical protein L484_018315 [Morus notabilis]